MDSTSGQLEPASGARASIPGQEYWPEGTASRVRAARAPEPTGKSEGKPSYGKNPGSRRKKRKGSVAASGSSDTNVVSNDPPTHSPVLETSDDTSEEPKDVSTEYVVYQTEPEKEACSPYELDKKLGRPHPFIDPDKKKPIENILSSEELWWNWRKPDKGIWSRWQRPKPSVERVSHVICQCQTWTLYVLCPLLVVFNHQTGSDTPKDLPDYNTLIFFLICGALIKM